MMRITNLWSKYTAIFTLASFVLLGFACTEIPPVLNPGGGGNEGGPVDDQTRQVLIEEFTGVRCVNCPAGSEAIEALLNVHGSQLVAVSIHAGLFAVPFPESPEDFANDESRSLLNYLGSPLGFPTAVVNRKKFDGEENRHVGLSSWAGFIAEELLLPPQIRIDLNTSFNDANGEVVIEADLYIDDAISAEDVRLSVFLTENSIVGPQTTPQGQKNDYVHKHVFRKAVTGFDGDPINESLIPGAVINRNLSIQLEEHWVPENCHVVALVHYGGANLEVIQAHEVAVVK
jgi:hypothetical protein